MVILKEFNSSLVLCLNDNFIVYQNNTGYEKVVQIPELDPNITKKHQVQLNENQIITAACHSNNGKYFAVSAGKQLIVYEEDFSVKKIFHLQRSASKIRFTDNNDILVADKTGDAYLCKFSEGNSDVCLLLGHLSMLLDILITDCGKFVITCDRDEKIRVSCYPNSYNIMSYCLGHREFVTNIEILNECLISASGDGTIRFWNFTTGDELCMVNTNDYVKDKDLINSFCKEMDEEKCEVSSLPIVDMQVCKSQMCNYIAVSLHNYTNVQMYTAQIVEKIVKCEFHSNVILNSVPICLSFTEDLYIMTADNLLLYKLKDGNFTENVSETLTLFYNTYKISLVESDSIPISLFYKRKFDNVQEYLKKKKQRLESKINC